MDYIQNKTFDEIEVGDKAEISHTLTRQDIQLFAVISGDVNPVHLDDEYAKSDIFHKIVAHGMWSGTLISTILGTKLPGPGAVYLSQTLEFKKPVTIGDTITCTITVTAKDPGKKIVVLHCSCTNQDGKEVISGESKVIAPTEKVVRQVVNLPKIKFTEDSDEFYKNLLAMKDGLKPLKTAVVHPVDENSLGGAIACAADGLIEPILIGPEAKIQDTAKQFNFDLSKYQIIPVEHSHAAAQKAVELANLGGVDAIMKGKIHTRELVEPIVDKANNLRTERRMSHVLAISIPAYPKTLFITDAALNIMPTLMEKRDIVQNAIDLFTTLGFGKPKVAIVSAVETVDEKIPSTLDATALCKMAERGQIVGGILDGPSAFDNAVSKEAARVKNINSAVAGDADIIVVPDVESGNMLYKQILCFSNVEAAGIVVGAKIPIILTSRAAGPGIARKASAAMALLYANKRHKLPFPTKF